MKHFIIATFLGLAICLLSQSFHPPSFHLSPIFDSPLNPPLPVNWRTTQQLVSLTDTVSPSLEGLKEIRASGSGQFSSESLLNLVHQISASQLIILDLREESHGFVNGSAVSWTNGKINCGNQGKTPAEVEADEQSRLQLATEVGLMVINPHKEPKEVIVKEVRTEKSLVESLGLTYVRLPITDHHRPSDQVLDEFIHLVKTLPSQAWLHFHCKGGKGRTSTFMTLYDMMLNANKVSLKDILDRQQLIGGANLWNIDQENRQKTASERLELVKNFYVYCQQVPDFHLTWSAWLAQRSNLAAHTLRTDALKFSE